MFLSINNIKFAFKDVALARYVATKHGRQIDICLSNGRVIGVLNNV